MNKPKKHKSHIIQKSQQTRSFADFEKTKKKMQLHATINDYLHFFTIINFKP